MQDFLVQLANQSDIVRDYLGVKGWKNIVKITDNSVHRFVGFKDGKPQIQARFIGHRRDLGVSNILMRFAQDDVFKHLDRKYQYSENVMFQSVWKPHLVKYATASFNPDANPESTSVDGFVQRFGVNESWADIHDTADGTAAGDDSTSNLCQITATTTNDVFSNMTRSIILFDTSTIGAGAIVSDADLKLYGSSKGDGMSQSVSIVSSSPASNTAVAVGDYDSLGTTKFATDITIASFSTAGYNTFALNASGKAAVIVDGVSKFGMRSSSDVANVSPWVSGANAFAVVFSADNGSNEPTLDVTYSLPATGYANLLLMGVG